MSKIDQELANRCTEFAKLKRQILANTIGQKISSVESEGIGTMEIAEDKSAGINVQTHLDKIAEISQSVNTSHLEIKKELNQYNRIIARDHWPSVFLYSEEEEIYKNLRQQILSSGYPVLSRGSLSKHAQADKFEIFKLIHIKIPPDTIFLDHIVKTMDVSQIYNGDVVLKLPDPVHPLDEGKYKDNYNRDLIRHPGDKLKVNGESVKICIVDTGIDLNHPDFHDRLILSEDFTDDGDIDDLNGHGTHCAGISAGDGTSSDGKYKGIAPLATLLSAKVLNKYGSGRIEWILYGLAWALDNEADVVNLSLGGPGITNGKSVLCVACDELVKRGIIVCVAAGNSGPPKNTIGSPGDAKLVETVGAVDYNALLADFSSRGPTDDPDSTGNKPNVVAPGVNIIAPRAAKGAMPPVSVNPDYTALSGTSMATPHITGCAALAVSWARANKREISPEEFRDILIETSEKLTGYNEEEVGNGIINLKSLLNKIKPLGDSKGDIKSTYCSIDGIKIKLLSTAYLCQSCRTNYICNRCHQKGFIVCNSCGNRDKYKDIKTIFEKCKYYEENYLDRVSRNLTEADGRVFGHPLVDEKVKLIGLHNSPLIEKDDLQNIFRILSQYQQNTGISFSDFPRNGVVTYKINKPRMFGTSSNIHLVAGVICDHQKILDRGETGPCSEKHITDFINKSEIRSSKDTFHFVGLYSPTGWIEDLAGLTRLLSGSNYRMFLISPGNPGGSRIIGPDDNDLNVIREILNPETWDEKMEKLKKFLDTVFEIRDWIKVSDVVNDLLYSRAVIIKLLDDMGKNGSEYYHRKVNGELIIYQR